MCHVLYPTNIVGKHLFEQIYFYLKSGTIFLFKFEEEKSLNATLR